MIFLIFLMLLNSPPLLNPWFSDSTVAPTTVREIHRAFLGMGVGGWGGGGVGGGVGGGGWGVGVGAMVETY